MFTGLIEAIGRTGGLTETAAGRRVAIETAMAADLADGESVSVNGVCLTVAQREANIFYADIGPETARITTLGRLTPGQSVNLERAMRADSRFGGHFVQGHVDGVGTVREVRADGDTRWIRIAFSPELAPFFVLKGSVAVDGVSLTVATLDEGHFDVMIIPYTWEHTSLSTWQAGARVNLECDVVGKYVARAVQLIR
jgi:riboflavin synthase